LEKIRQAYLDEFRVIAFELADAHTIPGFLSDFSGPLSLYQIWKDLFSGRHKSLCGAGFDTLGVDASGDLYPCETFVGREFWKLGNIFRGIDEKKLRAFQREHINALKFCTDCDIVNLCQGGCLAAGQDRDIVVNSKGGCEFMKEVIKISQHSYAKMREQF
jgi:radical SAM protein with 4Fe4S-binding SPASM domain